MFLIFKRLGSFWKKKSFARAGAGERAQQLRALVDFCGEPTLSFSTHTVDHNHLSLQFQEIPPLSMFEGTYRMHIHTCKQNTHRKSFLKVHENQEKGNQNTTLNYSHLGAMAVFLFRNFILISGRVDILQAKDQKRLFGKKS